jgi:xylulose-5-phosphate/fructose-6-phosphate phosphoketolase
VLHELLHGRPEPERFHVRGFNEQGTTTTPFSMVVLNDMSRYHLAAEALRRAPARPDRDALIEACRAAIRHATTYAYEHLEDPPEIAGWTWGRSD